MPVITIDGKEIDIPEGYTILQAAELLGIEIPVFCYHPRLTIAGNCRMCLVEVDKVAKPVASCAMPISDGMVIHTNSPMVTRARQGVLEFLLINHPLDCPICDQGGECDLQDIVVAYGCDSSRYALNKRAVPDKNFGPLIKTYMNRCIHCTRCVRFANEIAGQPELGAFGRGEDMEIGTYIEKAVTSELSGNMIDICPVGALTSKPYAFKGRPWELHTTYSIDVFDAVGSAIRLDTNGREVMRILPRLNEEVNEEWISDKVRFSYDGLKYQRLDWPYLRNKKGQLEQISWEQALTIAADKLRATSPHRMAAIVGDMIDAEAMAVLKDIMSSLGSPHLDCRQDGAKLDATHPCHYLFNTTIKGIEEADFCLLIGVNPRWEAPLINARIRKSYLNCGLDIALLGQTAELGYPYEHLGDDPRLLKEIWAGNHPLSKRLAQARKPMLILGQAALRLPDGTSMLNTAAHIAQKYGLIHDEISDPTCHWNGFNILHTAASRVAGLHLQLVPNDKGMDTHQILKAAEQGKIEVLYLLGADEINISSLSKSFVIYQGHHGDQGAHAADLILPGCAYSEKPGTYVNTEGRVQRAFKACTPPGEAQEDWRILRAIAEELDMNLPYIDLEGVRKRLIELNPLFEFSDIVQREKWVALTHKEEISSTAFAAHMENYYITDVITRHSPTMARCTQEMHLRNKDE